MLGVHLKKREKAIGWIRVDSIELKKDWEMREV